MGMWAQSINVQDLRHQTGSVNRIAGAGGDEFDVEFRAAEQEGKGPNIVDIVTDVGIQNSGYRHGRLLFRCISGLRFAFRKTRRLARRHFSGSARLCRRAMVNASQSGMTSVKQSRP